jgi:PadR family transcriptional regulator PadR
MARPDALQGSLPLLILKILASRGPLHGYGLATQIEGISEEVLRVEEGSLYPALHRLEEGGYIAAQWVITPNKRRARIYEITEAGRNYLDTESVRWRAITDAVGRILSIA